MWSPHLVRQAAQNKGYTPEEVIQLLAQIDQFHSHGVQPIMSLEHLGLLTGVGFGSLVGVIRRSLTEFSPYKSIKIKKHAGGVRYIYEPLDTLKHVQRWLLDHVLKHQKVSHYCYGVSSQYNQIQCAKQHCASRWMLRLDLKDFFGSIDETKVYEIYLSLGYSKSVAYNLARLCTYPFKTQSQKLPWGTLPQGAPTSTALANLTMRKLDLKLGKLSLNTGWSYTRYVDDLTFSTPDRNVSKEDVKRLYHRVKKLLFPFELNKNKTVFSPPGARKTVLGLLVDGQQPRLTKRFRQCVDVHLYYCWEYGVVEHAEHRKFNSPVLFLDHLFGKIKYAEQVEPKRAQQWLEAYDKIKQRYESRKSNKLGFVEV